MMAKAPFVRNPYNYDPDKVSNDTGLYCIEPSMAQQHMKDECDINTIVSRFGVTGQLPDAPVRAPTYGDFTGIVDYRTALDAIIAADVSFMALPAAIRERFDNDPALLVDFCSDPANRSEAIDLGLVPPPSKPDGLVPSPDVVSSSAEA